MIRGGHIDLAILGAMQVSEQRRPRQLDDPRQDGQGHGRRDGSRRERQARRRHHGARGEGRRRPKILQRVHPAAHRARASCTASSPTSRCIDVTPDGLVLREVAPGVSAREVQEQTEPTLKVAPDLSTMQRARASDTMPWPDKKAPDDDASEKKTLGKGVFRKCDGCGETLAAEALARQLRGVPALRPAPQARRRRLARAPARRRRARRVGRAPRAGRSARVRRRQDVPRARRRRAEDRRRRRRRSRSGARTIEGQPDRVGRVPLRVHGRARWARVVGEKVDAPLRARDDRAAARRAPPGLGRRAHAGGHPQPDADGQDGRRARAARRTRPALHQRAAAPDHRRRRGELRAPRRREHRRARRRSSASPGRASSRARSARSCPRASSAASSSSRTGWSTAS